MADEPYFTLGRIPELDDKSREFQIRPLLDVIPEVKRGPKTTMWKTGPTLNQGRMPACGGFSGTHRLTSEPAQNLLAEGTRYEAQFAIQLYRMAQTMDGFSGPHEGTSILGVMKALQRQGFISSYHWAGAGSGKVGEDIMDALSWVGPVEFGIPWANSMFQPRPSGLLEIDLSDIAGGHAICAPRLLLGHVLPGEGPKPLDLVGFQQTWGPTWGVEGGFCYMKLEDVVNKLMPMQSEASVITKENLVRK